MQLHLLILHRQIL